MTPISDFQSFPQLEIDTVKTKVGKGNAAGLRLCQLKFHSVYT